MTKEDNKSFQVSTKCWNCDNDYIYNDDKVGDHCHITEKQKGSVHRDCKINLILNHKNPVAFYNLKSFDPHLIVQELDKFSLKISVIPNGLE